MRLPGSGDHSALKPNLQVTRSILTFSRGLANGTAFDLNCVATKPAWPWQLDDGLSGPDRLETAASCRR